VSITIYLDMLNNKKCRFIILKYFFRQIAIMLWNFGKKYLLLCFFFPDCWTLLIWIDVCYWFEIIWIFVMNYEFIFRLLLFFWTLNIYWCMNYVWVYVDLFGLICNLNKVCEINKIHVDFWCCSASS